MWANFDHITPANSTVLEMMNKPRKVIVRKPAPTAWKKDQNRPNVAMASNDKLNRSARTSWKGDLRVSIEAPNGDSVLLHNQTGREEDNIRETYTVANRPELANFAGANSLGEWTLHVSDHAGIDVGKLNAWVLMIK